MIEMQNILSILNNHYNVKFNTIELLRQGGCTTYLVRSEKEKFLLKIISPAFMDNTKQSFNILLYLNNAGFPVPRIILSVNGAPYIEFNDSDNYCYLILFEFIDGREPDEGEDVEIIGELIGRLHNIMQEYRGDLPIHGKEFFIDRYIKIMEQKNYDVDKTKKFRDYGNIIWKRADSLPRGFCHGDMYRGNLLRTPSGGYYILDFDTSCIAFPMYDIMIICNATNYFDFDKSGYTKSRHIYERFLKGYTKYCTLNEMEIGSFFDLIAIYHYQLQATIVEIYGLNCIDDEFLDKQLDWLMRWQEQCELCENK